jgi:adenylosuccinate lyase
VENVAKGLVVNPMVIRRNLEEHLPFLATETVLMLATQRGGDRQELHERIRRHSMDAARIMKEEGVRADLLERLAGDSAFGMSLEELEELVDPRDFVGRAPEQVDRFLKEWVDPVLQRYSDPSIQAIGEADVRV